MCAGAVATSRGRHLIWACVCVSARQRLSSLNAAWRTLSEERLSRLDELSERRSQRVWQELSRRIQSAASNQSKLAQMRRMHARNKSALESERQRRVWVVRRQQESAAAVRGQEAALRLQQEQRRAANAAHQLAQRRHLALCGDNLRRQMRHRDALAHIRQLEEQMTNEARFKLKLDEARVEQFQRQRQMDVLASRQLAHVAANLRQAVRSGGRAVTFDRMAARADLESRLLVGASPACCRLHRPRSHTQLL
ncbi:GRB10-interacting GYF protein 2-like [Pollicipes pollicipes]|uniref:GRB10-interacting GYF protein 2-like n=1 Tax=Pollicipes pollicipes TaxID=41117 RepID=UPI0018850D37|nr:GRB10-interacting GYF protein 2-like [Pollicipes pollicipes]